MSEVTALQGLTTAEAKQRLAKFGPNMVAEDHPHPWLLFLGKFWAPVPWMLEATIALQFALGKTDEAAIIALLLVFNAVLGFAQENRANNALALLRKRLAIQVRVLRDGAWRQAEAQDLVPGDVVHLRMGDLAPADIRLLDGQLLLDQSALTGEALPVETGAEATVHAGAIVKRGEASGEVIETGGRTYFGKTAELVRTARTASHLETLIVTIVKYLVALDAILVAALLLYSWMYGIAITEVLPFALILLVASVPIALPATYTLATALGALELARNGVLVTRLSAIEEAAAMDVLASDKTGTITQNRLALSALQARAPYADNDLLRLAALACDHATQDPIDLAILDAAQSRGLLAGITSRLSFIPFDPETKRSEASYVQNGGKLRVLKGAPRVIAALVAGGLDIGTDVERMAADGSRVLAVAAENGNDGLQLAGLVALQDPPRDDSRLLIQDLQDLGVRVLMVSGDGPATSRAVAEQVGIGGRVCAPENLNAAIEHGVLDYDVFARVLPEDKFRLVQALQQSGHVVGMSGDGVNDAPALKQAEVGIAVASATDVAKAAASLVLTNPGLRDVKAAVETSRRINQRMLTYTMNKIIKTLEIAVFLSVGVMLTGVFVITPLLIVLLLFTNDFVTMSIATDNVSYARAPERWNIPNLMLTSGILAVLVLILSFAVFFAGRDWLHLPLTELQTLIFVMLVFSGQGNVYLVRERRHFWHSLPSKWLLLASLLDIVIVGFFSTQGIFMAAIPLGLVSGLMALVLTYLIAVDFIKIRVFRHFGF
ncbi:plasma-membrane proton-efflux P-type ATPase [Sideroxydans lithotrophicus]|uniref:Plasma-membrane proton-efflux P-type ATPase n=1 Tax=Sideroxydans lithotrophicus (strain ES-1) TaxID=580332 RepID=D5CU68_SIDLE|nr:plasma-membrane proton-efflux P-type ATPase [Sideroxydans lithotrophicus]ADE10403.1 plasma-membrane proton-efflux P-type ATPase [Sideroxydans lithotrophicus ES-1]